MVGPQEATSRHLFYCLIIHIAAVTGSILDWLSVEEEFGLDHSERRKKEMMEEEPKEAQGAPVLPSDLQGHTSSSSPSSSFTSSYPRTRRSVKIEEICCEFGCNLNDLSWRYC